VAHLVVLRCRNFHVSRPGNGDVAWPPTLLKKFCRFRSVGPRAAEARENASKKHSRAREDMAADTYRWRSVAAGWKGRGIGRGGSSSWVCRDGGGRWIGGGRQGLRRGRWE